LLYFQRTCANDILNTLRYSHLLSASQLSLSFVHYLQLRDDPQISALVTVDQISVTRSALDVIFIMSRHLKTSSASVSNIPIPGFLRQEHSTNKSSIVQRGSLSTSRVENDDSYTSGVGQDILSRDDSLGNSNWQIQASDSSADRNPVTHNVAGDVVDEAGASRPSIDVLEAAAILVSISKSSSGASSSKPSSAGCKRTANQRIASEEDDSDSEPEVLPAKPRNSAKRQKVVHRGAGQHDDDPENDSSEDSDSDDEPVQQKALGPSLMKRSQRILDSTNADHANLIAATPKIGAEYYDSDADDLPGPIKGMTKSHLFRNVNWGAYAKDESNDADFPTHPSFRQYVPGRFELLEDGTAADQKAKLIIKLTDSKGKKHIYKNPPPRDWNNQEAITALNKRTVQQIRRTTAVQFRARVSEYIDVERKWLLANLTAGKPTNGWKRLVADFNQQFAGKHAKGNREPRPARTQSSLSKEVGRFGTDFYGKGRVPVLAKKAKKVQKK
jgi:hypothetical protein